MFLKRYGFRWRRDFVLLFFNIYHGFKARKKHLSFLHDILEKIKKDSKLDLSLEYEQWEIDIPPYFLLYWWSTGRLNCISLNILEFRAQDKEEVLIKLWPPLYGLKNSYQVGSKEFYLLSSFVYCSHKLSDYTIVNFVFCICVFLFCVFPLS